uniref:Uncharacterized protein n=1 Tax=Palpitomonas bilix TaxID=652834 RepID=A0A7S3G3X9_9EUKA
MTDIDAIRVIVEGALKPGRTKFIHFPIFSTSRIHTNYIDCVKWWGDLILSKSVEEQITLWGKNELAAPAAKEAVMVVQEYTYKNASLWFLRFALDMSGRLLAVGNEEGKVFLFDLLSTSDKAYAVINSQCRSVIRMVAFNADASVLVWCCSDSTVWKCEMGGVQRELNAMQISQPDES